MTSNTSNTPSHKRLAIVIPYYKNAFFLDLLEAIAQQSNKDFTVYIGDDASPEDPREIIREYENRLSIRYTRFASRLGASSLVSQWNRCVEMVADEEWVWIIPDDDVISENCVQAFYAALQTDDARGVNVFSIPFRIIDGESRTLSKPRINPRLQTNYEFYMQQLKGEAAGSSLGDNIFRKQALIDRGGFVDFPKAWGSDHATVLRASAGGLIYCLQDAWFGFRQSGINISSQTDDGAVKMRARVMFAKWLRENEHLFPTKPGRDFYQFFYWKGEHYALHEWKLSLALLYQLMILRGICTNSWNPLHLIYLFSKRIGVSAPAPRS